MDRASDAPVAGSAGNPAEPRTTTSWLLYAGRSQTAAQLPVDSDPRSEPRNEPAHRAPPPSSPPSATKPKGYLLPQFYSGATGQPGHFSEGFLLRRLHHERGCLLGAEIDGPDLTLPGDHLAS